MTQPKVLARQLHQQLGQPLHIGGRILDAITGSQCRLVKQNQRQIGKAVFVLFVIQLLQQRVGRVELEHRFGLRHFLAAGFQNLTHLQTQVLCANGENGR